MQAGLALSAVMPIALASDALSIARMMELVDNSIILAVPGAMNAGLGQLLSGAAWRSHWPSRAHLPCPATAG